MDNFLFDKRGNPDFWRQPDFFEWNLLGIIGPSGSDKIIK